MCRLRAAAIVPDGVLYNSEKAEAQLRKSLKQKMIDTHGAVSMKNPKDFVQALLGM